MARVAESTRPKIYLFYHLHHFLVYMNVLLVNTRMIYQILFWCGAQGCCPCGVNTEWGRSFSLCICVFVCMCICVDLYLYQCLRTILHLVHHCIGHDLHLLTKTSIKHWKETYMSANIINFSSNSNSRRQLMR